MNLADRKVISVDGLETSLEDFKSELASDSPAQAPVFSAPLAPNQPTPAESSSGTVSLADLLASRSRIESYEAVAIVQSLCSVILESSPLLGTPTIELVDVQVNADGAVTTTSTGPAEPKAAIQCLGHILAHLLPPKDFMFLRERVVEKAVSSPPFYVSLQELSETLAYYERPGRAAQIRNVYERWHNRAPSPSVIGSQTPMAIWPALGSVFAAYSRQIRTGMVALGGLTSVSLIAYLVARSGSVQSPGELQANRSIAAAERPAPPSQLPVARPPDSIDSQGQTAPDVRQQSEPAPRLAASSNRPSDPVSVGDRGAVPVPRQSVGSSRGIPPARESTLASRPLGRPEPSPTGEHNAATSTTIGATPLDDRSAVRMPQIADPVRAAQDFVTSSNASVEATAAGGPIYSASNPDVVPPVVLFSQLPGPSPTFTPQHDVAALEVIISEEGAVESVRAVARPRNIAESVVLTNGLSAAKAWRFRPALRNGRPVRYRLLVALSTE